MMQHGEGKNKSPSSCLLCKCSQHIIEYPHPVVSSPCCRGFDAWAWRETLLTLSLLFMQMQDDPLAPFGAGETFAKFPEKKPEKNQHFLLFLLLEYRFQKKLFFCGNRRWIFNYVSEPRENPPHSHMVTCLVLGELFGCGRRRRERAIRPPMYTSYAYSHFPHSYAEYEISLWLAFAFCISGAWLWWNFSQRALSLTL